MRVIEFCQDGMEELPGARAEGGNGRGFRRGPCGKVRGGKRMEQTLFESGTQGYQFCRIPALLALPGGRVLAFCEGRVRGLSDHGAIHILQRVSEDGGRTWLPQRMIASMGGDTIGNPCPVYDRDTGRVWMFLNTNLGEKGEALIMQGLAPRTVGHIWSDDQGESWSAFEDLTASLKPADWTWYAAGPGHALQMRDGRLVIPCNHGVLASKASPYLGVRAHVILSEDHGRTWQLGGTMAQLPGNEPTACELEDGSIYLNVRRQDDSPCRTVAVSRDGGWTWEDAREDAQLPDPHCQGSVLRYPYAWRGCAWPLLFVNNPNPPGADGDGRWGLTVRMSLDQGATWPYRLRIHGGRTAYADLTAYGDGRVGCLYERGERCPYERIALRNFTLEELTLGQ